MFSSLRTRLTLWYVGFLALVIVIFGFAAYTFTIRSLDRDLNERLEEMARNFAADVRAEAEEEGSSSHDRVIAQSIGESAFRDYKYAVVSETRPFTASTTDFDVTTVVPKGSIYRNVNVGNAQFRVYETTLELGEDRYRLLVLHPLSELIGLENNLLGLFLAAAVTALILAGIGAYFLVRRSLAPVIDMSRQAESINATNLNERLTVKNEADEVGRLGLVINALLARLDASFEQQRRFMADASHELRTPLAIVRGESEVAISKGDRTTADYRSSLATVHDESLRLTKIVEDLFTLARADAGQFRATFAPVYLDEIVADAIRSIGVLARQKNILIKFSSAGEMPADGDESLLRRLFLNLLDNAVKYNRDGGTVDIESKIADGKYLFTITDGGRGIPQDQQAQIFDRFYRVDKARSRDDDTQTSGAGLGLAIARWIAELHNATISLASSDRNGSTFLVSFERAKS